LESHFNDSPPSFNFSFPFPIGTPCTNCATGTFRSSDMDPLVCEECGAGFYQDIEAQASCLPCIPGRYEDLNRSEIQCKACPINWYSKNSSSTSCKECTIGSSSIAGSTKCEACAAGRYGDGCQTCEVGTFRKAGEAAHECKECVVGKYQNEKGQASCLPCIPGK
jgi:hypothetical protein